MAVLKKQLSCVVALLLISYGGKSYFQKTNQPKTVKPENPKQTSEMPTLVLYF